MWVREECSTWEMASSVDLFGRLANWRGSRVAGMEEQKNWTVASGPKSSFQMRESFVFNLETKVLESGGRVEKLIVQVAWSPVLSFHSLWWFGVKCHLFKAKSSAKIMKIKRTKDLNCLSQCALNLFNTQVSQFELNYWNKWTFPQHLHLLRCTCKLLYFH